MAAMKLKKSKWNLLLDWQKKNCFENCRKKLPDHCIWVWWIMESCSMVTKWKLLNLINTEQYVLIKKLILFLDLSFSFRMKPVWMLLVDFEEKTKNYTSTMWQSSAKVPSWLATQGSSTCSYFEVRTRLLRKSKNIFFLFNCTTRLPILEQTVPLH